VDSLGEYKGDFKDYAKYSKQAFMSSLQIAIRIGGFKSYQLAMIVANGLVKQIMGRGLALAANAGLARAISVFAGPIGWAISAIWALFDIAGPAYRVIIPAVIYIAYLRLKFKNQRRGFILVGKSGHGKSSLINCLAGVDIAKVTHAKPTTPKTKVYNIDSFNGKYPLRIIDTRGIFESTKPNHRVSDDALQVLKNSMIRENPAVVMHIMSAKEVRAMSEDQKIFKELIEDIKITMNNHPKCIFVITKAGDLINPRNFPTKEHFTKIKEIMDYFCRDVLKVKTQPISATKPENGYIIISKNSSYQAVIPVKCLSLEKNWNINTLSSFLEKTVDKLNLHNCK
ncbi:MAG TPA: GTPase, partial [Ignavibacteria bacterium]